MNRLAKMDESPILAKIWDKPEILSGKSYWQVMIVCFPLFDGTAFAARSSNAGYY